MKRWKLLNPMSKRILLTIFCINLLLTGLAYGADLHVPSPYTTIQAAIDAAVDGDTVIVSSGTYYERITIGGKDIVLRSTNPDDWSVVEATIIDAQFNGRVVTFTDSNRTSACKLEGLTIKCGYYSGHGAGIYGNGSQATIHCCIIWDHCCPR